MSAGGIRCKTCGRVNELTAFACGGCGASLVGSGAERWVEARERDLVLESDAARVRARRALLARTAAVVVAVVVAATLGYQVASWYSRNHYVLDEPTFDGHGPEFYADMMVSSPDHFMRRRGAKTLDAMAPQFNERTAREVVPSLRRALADEDDVVRSFAKSALDKIAKTTGVT
jgi:hypothetical protein